MSSKTAQSRGSKDSDSGIYMEDKLAVYFGYIFFGSIALFLISFAVFTVMDLFGGSAESKLESTNLPLLAMVISGVVVFLCLVVLLVMAIPEGTFAKKRESKGEKGKKSKLPKGPNLKIAE